MTAHRFRFHSDWVVDADPRTTYDVLADLAAYPLWWPQVRSVTESAPGVAETVCRSALPYELALTMRATTQDPDRGVLEADLSGDLVGWSRWQLVGDGPRTRLVYDQEVELTKPVLRRLGRVLRAPLRANHTWMMRGARLGLQRYLASVPLR